MKEKFLTVEHLAAYSRHLHGEERAASTIEKYQRDAGSFVFWLDGRSVTKEAVMQWKEFLLAQGLNPVTVNAKLSAVNGLLHFLGWDEYRIKFLKIQRRVFREQHRELTKNEYIRLLDTARQLGRVRLELMMETICSTGIRVSEVQYITVESVQKRRAEVRLKGKIRTILLPGKLCRKLEKYAKKQKIASGEIFRTRSGNSISRRQIWREMKSLCQKAGVEPSKVFPHNLRHLFARAFYALEKDIVRLADLLGHSSVATTRIYTMDGGTDHLRQINLMNLVVSLS